MAKYSIITCISNAKVYTNCLLKSIKELRKDFDIEIIPIINNHNRYSASNALNIGIDVAKSQNLIFAHQDVKLLGNWFESLTSTIDELNDDWGILGAAGINLKYTYKDIGRWGGSLTADTTAVGSVWNSDESLTELPYWDGDKELSKIHCADECLFVLNKSTGLRFDMTFNGFHMYGIDICLQARAAQYGVYGANLPIIHYGKYSASFSSGSRYWFFLRHLFNKWRLIFPELLSTHMHWYLDETQNKYELTSYIPVTLQSATGIEVEIKAMGISRVRLHSDQKHGIIHD